jgi:anti-anti-sigma factor
MKAGPVPGTMPGLRESAAWPAPPLAPARPLRPAIIATTKVRQVTTPPQLIVITEHHGRRSVLRVLGELDLCTAVDLRCAVSAALEQHDPQSLTMDLSALTFADCAGLSVLVWARNCLAERGHELVITGSQPLVRRLLTLTGIDTYLRLSAPDGEATRRVAGPPPARADEGASEGASEAAAL